MNHAIAVAVAVAALAGCTVYQPAPVVVERSAPSAYWTVVHEQTQADIARRQRWEAEESLRRQQWTDAEIRHEQMNDLTRYVWAVRSVP